MKISVSLTVNLTPEQVDMWCLTFGVDKGNVREDVREYIQHTAHEYVNHNCGGEVTLKWQQ